MKRGTQKREKKALSAKGLIEMVSGYFRDLRAPSHGGKGRPGEIGIDDCLRSALAMFGIKSPSLLSFNKSYENKVIVHNLSKLYLVGNAPSDTYMRQVLDEVDPKKLRPCYLGLFEAAQRGGLLKQYSFLDGYLVAVDGTEIFDSRKIHCKNCCARKDQKEKITYYHQLLGAVIIKPGMRQVIPLCPEPIRKNDGTSKNDCEQRALGRFLEDFKNEHPRLKVTFTLDALYANAPQINELRKCGHHYIIVAKEGNNKSLFNLIKGLKFEQSAIRDGKNVYKFRFINGIRLNGTKDAPLVNYLECDALEVSGRQVAKRHFAWVTDHVITEDNLLDLMKGGRARWKIENETFNTLKNQGYQFEHNFGHGKKNLHTIFALLMVLAFAIDQLQEAACGLFQAAMAYSGCRRDFWERIRSFFTLVYVETWETIFRSFNRNFDGCRVDT